MPRRRAGKLEVRSHYLRTETVRRDSRGPRLINKQPALCRKQGYAEQWRNGQRNRCHGKSINRRFESGLFRHFKIGGVFMEETRPGYFAVIPADVRYDDRIPPNAKLLYGEISALIGSEGFCFASNQYFAELYGVTVETIARLLTKLEGAGHIRRVIEHSPTGQIITRKLYLKVSVPDGWGIDKKINTPIDEKINTSPQKNQEGIDKKVKDTDTSITVKEKDKKEKSKKQPQEKPQPLTDEELRPIVVDGINGLAQENWTADIKNELFRWVMALYDPNRTVRKAHPVRSKLSVDGTFRKLAMSGKDPQVMIGMLCTAIEGGWQGVQVPNSGTKAAPAKPAQEERQYRCL